MSAADFAAWTGGILALLGIVGVGVKILLVLHNGAKRLEAIELLATELAPNSGGSIKDKVDRTALQVGEIHGKVHEHTDRLNEQNARLAKTEAKVEALVLVTAPNLGTTGGEPE